MTGSDDRTILPFPNAFTRTFLDRIGELDEPPSAGEADVAGPWEVEDIPGFGYGLFRKGETWDRKFEPVAVFHRRPIALLAVAPIVNFEEFRAQARGSAKEQKLQSIAERSYVREGRPLDWERVQEVIETFGLKVRIVGPDGGKRLLYDASVPWEIYNLLDDDYLISQMTSQGYEVMAKRLHLLTRDMAVVPRAELERLQAAAAMGQASTVSVGA